MRHVLDITDLCAEEVAEVLELAREWEALPRVLESKGVALVFEKPSARTRSSTEMAVHRLGGHPVYIQGSEVGIDSRETAEDVARTLACYHSAICARVMSHATLERMGAAMDLAGLFVPVVNLLSDRAHPCQALADLLTMQQVFGRLEGLVLAFVGDANNVWRSLATASAMAGVALRIASPRGYGPEEADLAALLGLGADLVVSEDPAEAVSGADVIYTDVWVSMGQEAEAEERRRAFAGFQVDSRLVERASTDAVVMHCLPARRGEEISAEVMDGPRSVVWRQAANRQAAVAGLLAWLFGAGEKKGQVASYRASDSASDSASADDGGVPRSGAWYGSHRASGTQADGGPR